MNIIVHVHILTTPHLGCIPTDLRSIITIRRIAHDTTVISVRTGVIARMMETDIVAKLVHLNNEGMKRLVYIRLQMNMNINVRKKMILHNLPELPCD